MTIDPKVREALDKLISEVEDRMVEIERGHPPTISRLDLDILADALVAVISQQAVAAEREKYAPLVKAVKEWQEAFKEYQGFWGDEPLSAEMRNAIRERVECAEEALASLATTEGQVL